MPGPQPSPFPLSPCARHAVLFRRRRGPPGSSSSRGATSKNHGTLLGCRGGKLARGGAVTAAALCSLDRRQGGLEIAPLAASSRNKQAEWRVPAPAVAVRVPVGGPVRPVAIVAVVSVPSWPSVVVEDEIRSVCS